MGKKMWQQLIDSISSANNNQEKHKENYSQIMLKFLKNKDKNILKEAGEKRYYMLV